MSGRDAQIIGVTALVAASLFAGVPSAAAAVIYPWCAFYGRLGENCGFTTFQQCRATISGIGGYCGANPWYRGNPSPNGSPPQIRR
jgi:Protein of unknown function (DUF3551)